MMWWVNKCLRGLRNSLFSIFEYVSRCWSCVVQFIDDQVFDGTAGQVVSAGGGTEPRLAPAEDSCPEQSPVLVSLQCSRHHGLENGVVCMLYLELTLLFESRDASWWRWSQKQVEETSAPPASAQLDVDWRSALNRVTFGSETLIKCLVWTSDCQKRITNDWKLKPSAEDCCDIMTYSTN